MNKASPGAQTANAEQFAKEEDVLYINEYVKKRISRSLELLALPFRAIKF